MTDRTAYIIRHGETEWNRQGREQGRMNSPLTERGESQARSCAEILRLELSDINDFQIYCSPLGRTKQTVAIICHELQVDIKSVRFDPLLIECAWGEWEGLRWADIEEKYPGERAKREGDKWQYVPPEGESYEMAAARVTEWLGREGLEQKIIAITHGGLGRVLRGLLADMSPEEMLTEQIDQGTVFRVTDGNADKLTAVEG